MSTRTPMLLSKRQPHSSLHPCVGTPVRACVRACSKLRPTLRWCDPQRVPSPTPCTIPGLSQHSHTVYAIIHTRCAFSFSRHARGERRGARTDPRVASGNISTRRVLRHRPIGAGRWHLQDQCKKIICCNESAADPTPCGMGLLRRARSAAVQIAVPTGYW